MSLTEVSWPRLFGQIFRFDRWIVCRDRATLFYTLIRTATLNGVEPEAYLRQVIARIGVHPVNRLNDAPASPPEPPVVKPTMPQSWADADSAHVSRSSASWARADGKSAQV